MVLLRNNQSENRVEPWKPTYEEVFGLRQAPANPSWSRPTTTFHQFTSLPPEIQMEIWDIALTVNGTAYALLYPMGFSFWRHESDKQPKIRFQSPNAAGALYWKKINMVSPGWLSIANTCRLARMMALRWLREVVKMVPDREWPELQKRPEVLEFLDDMAKKIDGKLSGRL